MGSPYSLDLSFSLKDVFGLGFRNTLRTFSWGRDPLHHLDLGDRDSVGGVSRRWTSKLDQVRLRTLSVCPVPLDVNRGYCSVFQSLSSGVESLKKK